MNGVPALRPAENGNHFIFRDGYSRIILNTLQPFYNFNVFIKTLSSFVKGAMFINRNRSQMMLLHLQRIFNHSIKH